MKSNRAWQAGIATMFAVGLAGLPAWTDPLPQAAAANPPPKPAATADKPAAKASDKNRPSVTWYLATSDHFIAYSNQSKEDTERRLKALEQFRFFVTKLLPSSADAPPERKLTVYLVDTPEWLKLVDPHDAAGVYIACREGVQAFSAEDNDAAIVRRLKLDPSLPREDHGQVVLFHEYTHHVMLRSTTANYPLWYIEGLADYLSTFTFDGKAGHVGLAPYQNNWALGQINWGQFNRVLAPDDKLSSGLATEDGADPIIFYAKAWLLTHYMMSDPVRAKALNDYFDRLHHGADPVAAFKAATGIDPGGDLTERLRAYSRGMAYMSYPMSDMPQDFHVEVSEAPEVTNSFIIESGAFQACIPKAMGEWELKELKEASDPAALNNREKTAKAAAAPAWERLKSQAADLAKDDHYRMTVARGEILYGDPKAPLDYLGSIASGNPLYSQAQYLIGRAWLAIADHAADADKTAVRAKAVPFLERAYTLDSDDGPTQFFLAKSYEGRPDFPNGNALNAAIGAAQSAPSVYDYAAYAAWLELLKGDRDDALYLLHPFAVDPHRRERAKAVAAIVDAVSHGKSAADVKAMMDEIDKPKAEMEAAKAG